MTASLPPIPPPIVPPHVDQGPPPPDDKPSTRVRPSTLRLIGSVVVSWARLENIINDLIWTISGKVLTDGRLDTQDLDITKLLSALQRAVSTRMPGQSLQLERKAITDVINNINEFKSDRNAVVHAIWGELGNAVPVAGSLRFETTRNDFVMFESFDHDRLRSIEKIAFDAARNCTMLILRLEALRERPPQQPQRDESTRL
jgi:hypothetical protein